MEAAESSTRLRQVQNILRQYSSLKGSTEHGLSTTTVHRSLLETFLQVIAVTSDSDSLMREDLMQLR